MLNLMISEHEKLNGLFKYVFFLKRCHSDLFKNVIHPLLGSSIFKLFLRNIYLAKGLNRVPDNPCRPTSTSRPGFKEKGRNLTR